MMDKSFDAAAVETRISALWEETGAFRAGRPDRAAAKPFCVVIPPPNVTGNLHMGHALNNTLQDILCRYQRMNGSDVLWQPGTDHAGIATQMVVERMLMEAQEPDRRTMGREAFLRRVWAWKAEVGRGDRSATQASRRIVRLEPRAIHPRRRPVARRRPRSSSSSIAKGSSIRTSGWSTGIRSSRQRFRISKSSRSNAGVRSNGRATTARPSTAPRWQGPGQKSERTSLLFRLSGGGLGWRGDRRARDCRYDPARDDARRHGGCGPS